MPELPIIDFFELKKNLKKDFSQCKKIQAAILGDNTTQFLAMALKGYGYHESLNLELFEADYNQIERLVLDTSSELYHQKNDFVILFHSTQKLLNQFYTLSGPRKTTFAVDHLEKVEHMYGTLAAHGACKVIYLNFSEIDDGIFGNFAAKTDRSFVYQIKKLNLELMNLSMRQDNFFICDICALENRYGQIMAHDAKMYIQGDMVFSLAFVPYVAKRIVDIIKAVKGIFKKCIILDLDNTIWGGVIGDDGLENIQVGELGIGRAFTEFQQWIKQLQQRGIILAVCSKNEEIIAKEPFEKHPEMILRLDDIAVFVANWENKVDNIHYIQSILNIGFDSMVFLDDNPVEREMVRKNIHGITVPELPEDPVEYLSCLRELNLFETASYTDTDTTRTRQYQNESRRKQFQKSFTSENDFLKSLSMISEVKPVDTFSVPRVAQLTQRSNQFNLRTVRYTEADINKIISSDNYFTLSFTLEDKFGDNGLVSIIILRKQEKYLFIDTWIMSCRVLKRGMEMFVLNEIVRLARQNGFRRIVGEYIPTPKNAMVKNLFSELGFIQEGELWNLTVTAFRPMPYFIRIKESDNGQFASGSY